MSFHCAHRGFAQAVNDPNRGYLGSGNVMSNTQSSTYVRAFTQTDCAGREFPPGQLQKYDLAFFNGAMPRFIETEARRLSQDQDLILYRFFHWHRRRRIEHGWLITDTGHRKLRSFATGPTWRSRDVLEAVTRVITNARA